MAARASMFQDTILVVMPLAILGAPLGMVPVFAFTSFVTFFSHTELVGKLGWMDRVFVTPSVHRVHHGRNPAYLDKNYGASLVIWDQLFGTYIEETEPVAFGTLDGLDVFDPLMNNLTPFTKLLRRARTAPTWMQALQTLVMPGWDPRHGLTQDTAKRSRKPSNPRQIRYFVAMLLVGVGAVLQVGLAVSYGLTNWQLATGALLGLSALGVSGAVLDRGPAPWHRGPR